MTLEQFVDLAAGWGLSAVELTQYYFAETSPEYLASPHACRLRRGDNVGASFRFKPGHKTWNDGMKGWQSGRRSAETRFKAGRKPHTWVPVGSERVTDDGTLQRKVSDTGYPPRDWRAVHALIWEEHNGPVPLGHICVLKNRDKRDFRIENIEYITRAENMRRNSYHRYGEEVARAIQLRGALNRQINKRLRQQP